MHTWVPSARAAAARAVVLAALGLGLVGCGARTVLNVPRDDAGGADAEVDGVGLPDVPLPDGEPPDGPTCPGWQVRCNGTCVDTFADPANCGGCGMVCGAGRTCVTGLCREPPCEGGGLRCGGTCVDASSDPSHCGRCNWTCRAGEQCVAGSCRVSPCGPTLRLCGGLCVATGSDAQHCGRCGNACPVTHRCLNGACYAPTCPDGWSACRGTCTNLQADPLNCGRCAARCAVGETCAAGACRPIACEGTLTRCGAACVDTRTDVANCGGCGRPCGGVCSDGVCARATGWLQRFGASASDVGNAVATDGVGNVYVAGRFDGTVDFGGRSVTSAGFSDAFVASYTAAGALRWVQRFGSMGRDEAFGVAVDEAGGVAVVGYFDGTAAFGDTTLTSRGASDAFVARLDAASGAARWARSLGGAMVDAATAVATGRGEIVVAGRFQGDATLGAAAARSAGSDDAFAVAFQVATGSYRWHRVVSGIGSETAYGAVVTASGAVLVAGSFEQTATVEAGRTLASAGRSDAFVVAYAPGGLFRWAQRFGGIEADAAMAIAASTGAYVAAGYFSQAAQFGPRTLLSAGDEDAFVVQGIDATGAPTWAQRFGGFGRDEASGVAVDAARNVVFAGSFRAQLDFGVERIDGARDGFVASLTWAGAPRWARPFGGGLSEDRAEAVAVGRGDAAVVAGSFESRATFPIGGAVSSAGGADGFVMQYVP